MIFVCILLTDCNYFYVLLAVENVGIRSHTASKKQVYIPYLDNIELKCLIFYFRCFYFCGRIVLFICSYGSFKAALGEVRLNFAILEYHNA